MEVTFSIPDKTANILNEAICRRGRPVTIQCEPYQEKIPESDAADAVLIDNPVKPAEYAAKLVIAFITKIVSEDIEAQADGVDTEAMAEALKQISEARAKRIAEQKAAIDMNVKFTIQ